MLTVSNIQFLRKSKRTTIADDPKSGRPPAHFSTDERREIEHPQTDVACSASLFAEITPSWILFSRRY